MSKKNILDEILNASEEECSEAKELIEFIESLSKHLTKSTSKERKADSDEKFQEILKRTYYFRKDLINLLSLARDRCVKISSARKDIKPVRITKSKIVNIALEFLLNDFVKRGEKSFLFKRLFQTQEKE